MSLFYLSFLHLFFTSVKLWSNFQNGNINLFRTYFKIFCVNMLPFLAKHAFTNSTTLITKLCQKFIHVSGKHTSSILCKREKCSCVPILPKSEISVKTSPWIANNGLTNSTPLLKSCQKFINAAGIHSSSVLCKREKYSCVPILPKSEISVKTSPWIANNGLTNSTPLLKSCQKFINAAGIHSSSVLCKRKKRKIECCVPTLPKSEGAGPKVKMQIRNKVALVLGGATGIGYTTALELISGGASHVVITGHKSDECLKAYKRLKYMYGSGKVSYMVLDVNDPTKYEQAFEQIIDKLCGLDIVVNSIGVFNGRKWTEEFNVNVVGAIRGTLLAYDFMGLDTCGRGGIVINIAGTMGLEPLYGAATYAAANHAIVGFCRSYADNHNFQITGVRLVTLCPGFTETRFLYNMNESAMVKMEDMFGKTFEKAKKQKPECCSKAVLHLIKHAENGTVWVIEGAQLFALKFPKRKTYSSIQSNFIA